MGEEKRIKDIMVPVGEYEKVGAEDHLCDALAILKRNYEKARSRSTPATFHKTVLVTDQSDRIIGKLSMFDLIRGLVPGGVRDFDFPERHDYVRSSRMSRVAEKTAEIQERFGWLNNTFVELVKQEAHKKVKDIMSSVHPMLEEDDTLNVAVYLMFKENVRQPLVVRDGEVVGVIDLMRVFSELLEIAGPECDVYWEG
jgi:CBS domain-containing protein